VLRRALLTIAALTAIAVPIMWALFGWRNVCLLVVGAGVSATGVWEWQRLLTVLIATMDTKPEVQPGNTANKPSTGLVLAMFLLRLVLAAGALYVSLKCCNGSVYALLGGLALSLVALGIEAVRLLMQG
jgi:hypothetical protein